MQRRIVPIKTIEIVPGREAWAMAKDRAAEIQEYWLARTKAQPKLFNGEVLLLKNWSINDGVFQGEYFQTDYKSFLWWREHDRPDRDVYDFFGAAVLHSRENWLILGVMGPHTSSPGQIYFPCGSPSLTDVSNGKLD